MNKNRLNTPGFFCHKAGGDGIDLPGFFLLGFRPIHVCIGGRIDDHLWAELADQVQDGFRMFQVNIGTIDRYELPQSCQGTVQFPAQLPGLPDQKNVHHPFSLASWSRYAP